MRELKGESGLSVAFPFDLAWVQIIHEENVLQILTSRSHNPLKIILRLLSPENRSPWIFLNTDSAQLSLW